MNPYRSGFGYLSQTGPRIFGNFGLTHEIRQAILQFLQTACSAPGPGLKRSKQFRQRNSPSRDLDFPAIFFSPCVPGNIL
jgi:hypothetical protein